MGTRANELADRFDQAVADFRQTVESCPDARWGAQCEGGWTVGQTAEHVAGQFPLESEFIFSAADGKPLPAYTWDDVNGKNDNRAAANKNMTKADVIKTLNDGAAKMSAYIRGLSDEQLDRKGTLGLANGAEVTTQQLLEGGVLIDHVGGGHLQSIRNAIG